MSFTQFWIPFPLIMGDYSIYLKPFASSPRRASVEI
nr:MAG TPA: hypothetical protein [Caudoviricetes sp.]